MMSSLRHAYSSHFCSPFSANLTHPPGKPRPPPSDRAIASQKAAQRRFQKEAPLPTPMIRRLASDYRLSWPHSNRTTSSNLVARTRFICHQLSPPPAAGVLGAPKPTTIGASSPVIQISMSSFLHPNPRYLFLCCKVRQGPKRSGVGHAALSTGELSGTSSSVLAY